MKGKSKRRREILENGEWRERERLEQGNQEREGKGRGGWVDVARNR